MPAHGHQQQTAGQQNRHATSKAENTATTARTAARWYTTTSNTAKRCQRPDLTGAQQ
jgi:hypothetical protein